MGYKIFTKFRSWDNLPVLIDINTLCALLQCSEVTARRYMEKGLFRGNKLDGKWMISRDSVRDFFEKGDKA